MWMTVMRLVAGSGEVPESIVGRTSDDALAAYREACTVLGIDEIPAEWAALLPVDEPVPQEAHTASDVYVLEDATVLVPLAEYTAPPTTGWLPADSQELLEKLAAVRDAVPATKWHAHALSIDEHALERGIDLAAAGRDVYTAEDEDGVYVAVAIG